MIYYIVDIVSFIFQAAIICICMDFILSSRFKLLFNILIFSCSYVLFYIAYKHFGMSAEIRYISAYIMYIILFFSLYKDKLRFRLLALALYILVIHAADVSVSYIITGIYGSYEDVNNMAVPRVIGTAIYNIIYFSLYWLGITAWRKFLTKDRISQDILVLISVPISQLMLLYGNFAAYLVKKDQMLVFTFCGILLSILGYISFLRINKKLIQKANLENRLTQLEQNQLLKFEHIKEIDILDKHNKSFHHDIKNQLSVIQILLSDAKNAQALEMLKTLSSDIHEYDNKNYCSHPVINAVLCKKSVIASDSGIKMNIETYISDDITVKSIDLCSIFSNLIDNAIEACNNITDSAIGKFIDVKAGLKQEYMIIRISNSKSNEINMSEGKIQTSKPNSQNHGLGLSIVKDIASKYEGSFTTDYTANDFTATVLLDTKKSLATAV